MAKGQIESIGLVLIVVLVVLILVISLPFVLKEDKREDNRLLSLKADALRNSVLSYNRCKEVSIKEELINCEFDTPRCEKSCEEMEKEIKDMIDSVLEPNIIYEFNVESRKSIKIGNASNCLNKFSSSLQPLSRDVKVEVSLCRK